MATTTVAKELLDKPLSGVERPEDLPCTGGQSYADSFGLPASLDDPQGHQFVTFRDRATPANQHDLFMQHVSDSCHSHIMQHRSKRADTVEKLRRAIIGYEIWNIVLDTDHFPKFVCKSRLSREEILVTRRLVTNRRVFQQYRL